MALTEILQFPLNRVLEYCFHECSLETGNPVVSYGEGLRMNRNSTFRNSEVNATQTQQSALIDIFGRVNAERDIISF